MTYIGFILTQWDSGTNICYRCANCLPVILFAKQTWTSGHTFQLFQFYQLKNHKSMLIFLVLSYSRTQNMSIDESFTNTRRNWHVIYMCISQIAHLWDCDILQNDINCVAKSKWCSDNRLDLNVLKCKIIPFGRSEDYIKHDYKINNLKILL